MANFLAPILEFDPTREAFIEPSRVFEGLDMPEHCVMCFFKEVLEAVVTESNARVLTAHEWADGSHRIYEIKHLGKRLAFMHAGMGGPLSAGLLEDAIARGCRKFIVCGGCGALDPQIAVGYLVVVSAAVRDEGVSYHYMPPSREVQADAAGMDVLQATLTERGLPFVTGKTWTTDAPYRETPARIASRRSEGCLTVEMEAASLMAVAQFRRVVLGQILYGGDDLSGEVWNDRGWTSKKDVRENLFWLAADACLRL